MKALEILKYILTIRKNDEMWHYPTREAILEAITELEELEYKLVACMEKYMDLEFTLITLIKDKQ